MTEIDKNVLTDLSKNQKVEVVVKRDASARAGELDLVRVFSNMGKKRKIYAWLIIACMFIGLAAPLLMAELKDRTENVSVVINLLYPSAQKRLAPDGKPLDVNYIKSSYILQNAIKKTQLSEKLPISALERNISIEELLSEDTRQKLEVVEKVINETSKDYEEVLNVDYKYEGKYIITLSNGFSTDPEAKKKTYLEGSEMTSLLNNIAEAYSEYFYDTYMDLTLPDNTLDSIRSTDLDYIERLDEIVTLLNSLSAYCTDDVKEQYLNYRSKIDGLSFADINDCIRLVRDIDVDYLYAYVFYNSITKDKKSMVTKYNYQLKNAERELEVILGNIKNNEDLIAEYKNKKIEVSMVGQASQTSSTVTDYYNDLIMSQSDNYNDKSDLGERIANLNDKIAGFNTSSKDDEQITFVKEELTSLVNICSTLYELTEEHAKEILESDSYKSSFINYIGAQYLKDSFFNAGNIKKAIIGMVVGAFLAVVIWGMDGLIEEFKRGSSVKGNKDEQNKAAQKA